jgi:molybdopterin biosynthesis enzyme
MMGRTDFEPRFVDVRISEDLEKRGERANLIPAVYRVANGGYEAKPLKLNGSADIIGCAGCNGLIFIGEGPKRIKAGECVALMLIGG